MRFPLQTNTFKCVLRQPETHTRLPSVARLKATRSLPVELFHLESESLFHTRIGATKKLAINDQIEVYDDHRNSRQNQAIV